MNGQWTYNGYETWANLGDGEGQHGLEHWNIGPMTGDCEHRRLLTVKLLCMIL